jgi:nucleotide-binding universal stress UspA family protein
MNARTILYATDFSQSSEAALEYASSLARDQSARLLIVHVEEPAPAYGAGEYMVPPPSGEAKRELARLLAHIVPAQGEVPYTHRLLLGDPASEIIKVATNEDVELIVMGTHGRTGLVRLLMGSVAETVVRRAECPVLTIKQPQPVVIDS